MDKQTIQLLGDELYQALITGQVIEPLTNRYADITINDGYQIQSRLVGRRIEKGARVVGKKNWRHQPCRHEHAGRESA
jgi:2-oxopent-4-enoate/cis-2-oxohex-4-enoate hydratase